MTPRIQNEVTAAPPLALFNSPMLWNSRGRLKLQGCMLEIVWKSMLVPKNVTARVQVSAARGLPCKRSSSLLIRRAYLSLHGRIQKS